MDDWLYMYVFHKSNSSTPATPSGWTQVDWGESASGTYALFRKKVTTGGSQANVTITGLTSSSSGSMAAFSGLDTTEPNYNDDLTNWPTKVQSNVEGVTGLSESGNQFHADAGAVVVVISCFDNDGSSSAWAIQGSSVGVNEIGDGSTTSGTDNASAWAYTLDSVGALWGGFNVTFTEGGAGTASNVALMMVLKPGTSNQTVTPSGIASAGAFGTAVLTTGPVDASPSGIATAEAFGTATVTAHPPTQGITVSGIASTEAHGTAVLTTGPVTVTPSGISSAGAFGSATLTPGPVDLAPAGIATAAAFGSATLTTTVTITTSGIASAEAHGSTTVAPGPVDVAPTGIATAGAFGTATVTLGGATHNIAPSGLASAEAFGSVTISTGAVDISLSGIASAEALGSVTVTPGAIDVAPSGLATAEAFGSAVVTPGAVDVSPSGLASAEAFGTALFVGGGQGMAPAGIASAETFGTAVTTPGPVGISVTGISSAEAFGTATVTPGAVTVSPTGIPAPIPDELSPLGFNGDFETTIGPWYAAGPAGATVTRDTTESATGSAAMKLVHGSLGGDWSEAGNDDAFANGAGAKRISFWMKSSQAQPDVQVWPFFGNAPLDWSEWATLHFPVTTSWQFYEGVFDQTAPMFTGLYFDQMTAGGAVAGTTLWVDGIIIEGIPEVTTGPPDQDIAPGRGITTGLEFGTPTVLAEQELVTQGIASGELFGGPITVTHQVFIASTPSHREAPSGREFPFRRVELERGTTVYVIDGVYHQIQRPLDDLVADEIYFGGRDYEVTAAKATELEAQGFRIRTEIR